MDTPVTVVPGATELRIEHQNGVLVAGDHNHVAVTVQARRVTARAVPDVHRPQDPAGFLDRHEETGTALDALKRTDGAILEVSGARGIGKSWFLRHVGAIASTVFADGAVRIPAGERGPDDVMQALFEAFYVLEGERKPGRTELRELLGAKHVLAMVDDAEFDDRKVEALHDTMPRCALALVHDEPRLRRSARVLELGGLPIGDAMSLLERRSGKPLAGAYYASALAHCKAVYCNPDELANGTWTPEEPARTAAASGVGQAAASAKGLTPDERTIVETIAAFEPRPVPLACLAELSGLPDAGTVTGAMVGAGWLQLEEAHVRLRPRALSAIGGALSPDALAAHRTRGLVRLGEIARRNPRRRRVALSALALLWHGLTHAREAGSHSELMALGRAWDVPLTMTGRWDAAREMLQWHAEAAHVAGNVAEQAWALHQQGTLELALDWSDSARDLLEQALSAAQRTGDEVLIASSRYHLDLLIPVPPTHGSSSGPQDHTPPVSAASTLSPTSKIVAGIAIVGTGAGLWAGTAPRFEASATQLDFGAVTLTSAAPAAAEQTLRIQNGGWRSGRVAGVTVSGAAAAMFDVQDDCRDRALGRGESCEVRVRFRPQTRGSSEAALMIGGTSGKGAVRMTGVALGGQLSVVERVEFAAADVGEAPTEHSVTVRNTGDAPVRLAGNRAPATPFALRRDGCGTRVLAPGEDCTLTLAFRPAAPGRTERELVLRSDEPGRSERLILLIGEGRAAQMQIAARDLAFGNVEVGATSRSQPLVIENAGNAPMRLRDVAVRGGAGFRVDSPACAGQPIAPGGRCELQAVFAPTGGPRGSREARVRIQPAVGPATDVRLSATVLAPVLSLNPGERDFGTIEWKGKAAAGARVERHVQVRNEGDAPLRVNAVRVQGAAAADFSVNTTCAGALAPGQSCDVALQYAPAAPRASIAELYIDAPGAEGRRTVVLRGAAIDPVPAPPQLVSPATGQNLRCDQTNQVNVNFAWQPGDASAAGVRYRLVASGADAGSPGTALSASRTFGCPARVTWRVEAVSSSGRTASSEQRTLELVAARAPAGRVALRAQPQVVSPGGAVQLCWSMDRVEQATIVPEVGVVRGSGCRAVTPRKPTQYTLIGTDAQGQTLRAFADVQIASVRVPDAPAPSTGPAVTFTPRPYPIEPAPGRPSGPSVTPTPRPYPSEPAPGGPTGPSVIPTPRPYPIDPAPSGRPAGAVPSPVPKPKGSAETTPRNPGTAAVAPGVRGEQPKDLKAITKPNIAVQADKPRLNMQMVTGSCCTGSPQPQWTTQRDCKGSWEPASTGRKTCPVSNVIR